MSLFSRLHRHQAPVGYGNWNPPYGRLDYRGTDGMNTVHAAAVLRCVNCGKEYDAVLLHFSTAAWDVIEPRRKL